MMKKNLTVFKIGGPVFSASTGVSNIKDFNINRDFNNLISYLSTEIIPGQAIVIHGGGELVNCWLERFGIKPAFIDGQRVTDEKAIQVVEMVLSGLINKRLVSKFNEKGFTSIGISGRDLKETVAEIMDEKLGFVGQVKTIKPDIIYYLLEKSVLPVLSPVCENYKGKTVNVNADYFASIIAVTVKAEELNIITPTGGVLKRGELLKKISLDEAVSLIENKIATEGMIPKLRAAICAREGGVKKVRLLDYAGKEGTVIE